MSIFFNKTEYNPHEKTAANIHKSPLVKFKFIKFIKSALEIISMTPKIEKIMPKNWIGYVGVLKINQEKKIINNGVMDVIIDELITIDV